MKFSKKTKYVLLGLLVIFNIILRLPVTPHEIGADSFANHALANSISADGYAKWILNPLSFFGLYPFSYPSGELFLLSGISQCTGVDMEWTIWIAATSFGVLGAFTAYIMAKTIKNDFLFAFLVAFIYSLSPVFIEFTNWGVSTRGLFMALLPVLIWSLLRSYNQKKNIWKYIPLSVGLIIVLGTVHRMVLFTPLILIAFITSRILYFIGNKFKVPKITPKTTALVFFVLVILLFLVPLTRLGFYHDIESFQSGHKYGYFFHGSTTLHILLNLGAEYAMAVGIFILIVPIGLILLLLINEKTFSDVFVLANVLCFAAFLADATYMIFFVLFLISLLIAFGLMGILKMLGKIEKVKGAAPLIIIAILLFSALLPYFVVIRPTSSLPMHTEHMNELTYNAALFIKTHAVEIPRISNAGVIFSRINAIAGPPYYHEDINKGSLHIRPISLLEFAKGAGKYDYLYVRERKWYGYLHWTWDCDSNYARQALDNETHLFIEDNYRRKDSAFHQSLHETRPKIYGNGLESIYFLNY